MVQLWVQIHDLGLEMINAANAEKIRRNIGGSIKAYGDIEKATHHYLGIKIEVDMIRSPIAGFCWTNSEGKENQASIKYEKLSYFCYGCGKLGHTTQACKE